MYLASNEYPVSWLSPVTAAYTGVTIELLGATFLAVGFITRYAALSLLILTLVIQSNYKALDSQLYSAALLGWYVLHGAGSLSFDRVLRRGLADSALPLAARIVRASAWVRMRLAPIYLSVLRMWMALGLLLQGLYSPGGSGVVIDQLSLFIPSHAAMRWSPAMTIACGWILLLGIATRYVAATLVLFTAGAMMAQPALVDGFYTFGVLMVLIVFGAGPVSADAIFDRWTRRRFPELEGRTTFSPEGLPRIVIVGAGFAGLSCAMALRRVRASVTVIDRGNYHLFQPLLYQVATAALSPGDVATPIRPLFREFPNTRVLLGSVNSVDTMRRRVLLGSSQIPYDILVIATGAAHSYFGKDEWQPVAPGLKRIEDATAIRSRLLTAFENAESCEDAEERASLLTFLIVGGGPTGVELAGAIAELARYGMDKEFRQFDPASSRIILVQSGPRVLPAFDEKLSRIAQSSLKRLGVEVLLDSRVEQIDAQGILVSGRRIAARTVLWAAGVMASPAARWLGCEADRAGRIIVEPDLRVRAMADVYAIGDTSFSTAWNGQPVPGLAPAAKQEGSYVARVIGARLNGDALPPPFRYRHRGSLATIGRKAAVADFGRFKLWGAPAWWLWGVVHVGFLVGMRSRVATMTNWFWAYLTFGGGIRLITSAGSVASEADRPLPESGLRNLHG
jgi:putative oxidoreductase